VLYQGLNAEGQRSDRMRSATEDSMQSPAVRCSRQLLLEDWTGSIALMMPHCAPITSADQAGFKDAIRTLLVEKFVNKNLVHPDVRW
jgi:hypothetical protein